MIDVFTHLKAPVVATFALAACANALASPANPAVIAVKQPDGKMVHTVLRGDEHQAWRETLDGYTILKGAGETFFYARRGEPGQGGDTGGLVPSEIVARETLMPEHTGAGAQSPWLLFPKHLRPRRYIEREKQQDLLLQKQRTDWIRTIERQIKLKNLRGQNWSFTTAPANTAGLPGITGTWAPQPVVGERRLLLVLIGFEDAPLRKGSAQYWSNLAFGAPGPSVATYYRENSYGKVSIVPVPVTQPGGVTGVVTVSLPIQHPNYGNNYTYENEVPWIRDALAAASRFVDFDDLDIDLDGEISIDETLIYFVLGGYETAAATNLTPSIWAHQWGGQSIPAGKKSISNWAVNGEMYDAKTRIGMGLVAHEMGHAMAGLPDLYDKNGFNGGLGGFSLMSVGNWGARQGETRSTTPVGLDAWTRHYLGWSNPRTITSTGEVSLSSSVTDSASAILLANFAASSSEYWLVENRPQVGWDAGLASLIGSGSGGILIQHIDANVGTQVANTFNAYVPGKHQGNVVEAPLNSDCNLVLPGDGTGCEAILYWAPHASASESLNYYSGKSSGFSLQNISSQGEIMTAKVMVAAEGG